MTKEGITANNMLFFCYDLIDGFSKVAENEFRRAGFREKPRIKILKDQIKYAAYDLRKITRDISMDDQTDFGETVDGLMKLLLIVADRSERNPKVLELVTAFAEKFESGGLNIKKFGV